MLRIIALPFNGYIHIDRDGNGSFAKLDRNVAAYDYLATGTAHFRLHNCSLTDEDLSVRSVRIASDPHSAGLDDTEAERRGSLSGCGAALFHDACFLNV